MPFDNHYPNRKDHRKQYETKACRHDRSCRPGGSCPWCKRNRTVKAIQAGKNARREMLEFSLD